MDDLMGLSIVPIGPAEIPWQNALPGSIHPVNERAISKRSSADSHSSSLESGPKASLFLGGRDPGDPENAENLHPWIRVPLRIVLARYQKLTEVDWPIFHTVDLYA